MNLIKNKKILLQFSGGKDSVACFLFLRQESLNFETIHFTHSYSYEIPTNMVKKICSRYKIKLTIINIEKELNKLFLNNFNKRPCRYCKSIMDSKTIEYATRNNFDLICVGDTKDDSMLVNRIKTEKSPDIKFSKYFNERVILPNNILIYRPLIEKSSTDILNYVHRNIPDFIRVNDTGDKYFEYSREGCPLQFKDLGAYYTRKLMTDLKEMNTLCSEFATLKNIKAAIHLPSEFIVTIPKGYEDDCRNYLIEKGYKLKEKKDFSITHKKYSGSIILYDTLLKNNNLLDALKRFLERLNFKINIKNFSKNIWYIEDNDSSFLFHLKNNILDFILISSNSLNIEKINNIILEIFHTYNYKVFDETINFI